MSEKRFVYGVIKGSRQAHIKDCHNCKSATIDVYDDDFKYFVDLLNEQQATINKQLDQIIELQDKYRILEFNHSRLEKRNKAQYEKIGEQQSTIQSLKEENEQLKIANAKWLDKSLQDKQIRYNNSDHNELVHKYLQLKEETEQLQQIMKDIVVATDETYAKNMSMFKVTVVLDYEKYREIKECLYE